MSHYAFTSYRDTVSSVGLIPRTLPFTMSNTAIRTFRHAVALDEHRVKFKPNLWRWLTSEEVQRRDSLVPAPKSRKGTLDLKAEVMKEVGKIEKVMEEEEEEEKKKKKRSSLLRKKQHGRAVSDTKVDDVKKDELSLIKTASKSDEKHDPSPAVTNGPSPIEHARVAAVSEPALSRSSGSLSRRRDALLDGVRKVVSGGNGQDEEGGKESPTEMREKLEAQFMDRTRPTDVEEVWFAGCHCGEC